MAFQDVTALSGTFDWRVTPQSTGQNDVNRSYNVSVIDGKNQYVNAGISYTRRPDIDLIHLSLAKRATDWLAFGAAVKRFSTHENTFSFAGQPSNGFEATLSTTVLIPSPITEKPISLGLVADNVRNKAEYEKYSGPRQLGAGVKLNFRDILMVYGDVVENYSHQHGSYPVFSGGPEVALGGDFYARGGMFGSREKGWSAGLGWVGPKLGISYGYQNSRIDDEHAFQHGVTLDVYM